MTEYARTYILKKKAFEDHNEMPFGKWKGSKMEDVPADYLLYLWNENVEHTGVRGYIVMAFDALVQECPDKIVTSPTEEERKSYK